VRSILVRSSNQHNRNFFVKQEVDETLSNETDIPGVAPADLSDISIQVTRYKNPKITEFSDKIYQRLLKTYQNNMLEQAKVVDETSFSKHGITHATGLVTNLSFDIRLATNTL
jgi:hypothetical protein